MKQIRILALASIAMAGCAVESSATPENFESDTQQLPKCNPQIDDCVPTDPPPPPPPPPPVSSIPDVAMEIVLPVPCTTPGLQQAIEKELANNFPAAQRATLCIDGNKTRIGLWLRALNANEDAAARGRGLTQTSVLAAGETAGMRVPATVLSAKVESAWAAQPKLIDHEGNANPNGPVHLTSKNLNFDGANRKIVFTVNGYDTDPIPDVNFNFRLSSTFSTLNGKVGCVSATDFDADSTWQWIIGGLLFGSAFILPAAAPFTSALAAGFFAQGTIISSLNPSPSGLGAGSFCDAASMFPDKILLRGGSGVPARQKIVFDYRRASTDAGITGAGLWTLNARAPTLQVAGTRYIDLYVPKGFSGPLTLEAVATVKSDDMIAPTFTLVPEAGGTMTNLTTQATFQSRTVRWPVASASIGQEIKRTFSASAVDVEGLQASGSTFFVFRIKQEASDTPSPACKAKPWLPQCG